MNADRARIVEALRDYLYYRDAFGDGTLAALDEPDVVRAELGVQNFELG